VQHLQETPITASAPVTTSRRLRHNLFLSKIALGSHQHLELVGDVFGGRFLGREERGVLGRKGFGSCRREQDVFNPKILNGNKGGFSARRHGCSP
jgi:hypothetical protein